MPDLKEEIRAFAKSLGFCAFGAAKAEPLEEEIELYKIWLSKGYAADMDWARKALDKRADIRKVLKGANSALVFAHSYYTVEPQELPEGEIVGKISRYAWGKDYHRVILKKLKKIEKFMKERGEGTVFKSYVDTGPVLEKQWGVRAGIGWQGKNGNLISRTCGSYFFLGVILTDAKFSYDEPSKNYCGTCRACLKSCPTGAIVSDKVVDSRKCISYWTIESKADEIPPKIAAKSEGFVFGCDICQEVCPWNKFARKTGEKKFYPISGRTFLTWKEIDKMDEDEFNERFKGSPIKRAGLKGLRRNFEAVKNNKAQNS